jgi:leucyl-tRNA synthetase
MELTNAAYGYLNAVPVKKRSRIVVEEVVKRLLLMLAPFAPHISEELWSVALDEDTSIHSNNWPQYDDELCVADEIELPIQINGKVRGRITVAADADEERVKIAALSAVSGYLDGNEVKKLIVVPRRIVTIVI